MPIQAIGYHPELVESYIITLAMQNHFVYVSRAQRALLCLLLMMFALTVNGQTSSEASITTLAVRVIHIQNDFASQE